MDKKLRCIIVGAGHRAVTYASYAKAHPEQIEVVGVADPSEQRRQQTAKIFDLEPRACFKSAEDLAQQPKMADFVINGTMDHQHVPTALPLLERGYDMLLEKPFATNEAEMWLVADFLAYLNGRSPSLSTTCLEDSIAGHLVGFCANRSVDERRVIDVNMAEKMNATI